VWHFTDDEQTKSAVKANDQHEHTHIRKSPDGGHRTQDDLEFFDEIAKVLAGVPEILVIGPAQVKDELVAFLHKKHPQVAFALFGVQSRKKRRSPRGLRHSCSSAIAYGPKAVRAATASKRPSVGPGRARGDEPARIPLSHPD
jgi:hypothetical protein